MKQHFLHSKTNVVDTSWLPERACLNIGMINVQLLHTLVPYTVFVFTVGWSVKKALAQMVTDTLNFGVFN